MKIICIAALLLCIVGWPARLPGQEQAPLDESLKKSLSAYLLAHYQTPEAYIVSKFKDHDLVYVGESHLVKQEVLLLQRLIPELYKAGVYDLALEMGLSSEQSEIDKLIEAPAYDNSKALTLMFHWDPQIAWAFQEYADIYRAAWEVNHKLPKGAPHFRIIGIDYRPDWSLVKPGDNVTSRQTRWKAWAGSNQITRNVTMADLILRELVAKHRKALLYGGSGHTPLLPTLDQREETGIRFSAAYLIGRQIGDRITSVRIVVDSSGKKMPVIDSVLAALPAKSRTIGFDLKGSPLGDLPLPEALASKLVTDKKPVTFADEVEGVVHLNEDPEVVTLAPGFITESLVAQAKHDGWLPNLPSVTLDWILANIERFTKVSRPSSGRPSQ
jgi:hypothetical protein